MRLTLRTMLAYMDGILEPGDAEELRRKIEQNEGAAGILHRVRDVQCRLRLGAPKVEGRGLGGDANTVAEYLDNTLAADRIPEFERVCLESDAHLAESAACHHILALVLGERADVDPELRRKLYGLIDAPQQPPEPAPPVAAPPVAEPQVVAELTKTRRKPAVPDYLRDRPRSQRTLRWVFGVAAVLLLAAMAVMAIGPDRLLSRLRGTSGDRQVAVNEGNAKDTTNETAASDDVANDENSERAAADGVDVPPTEIDDAQDETESTTTARTNKTPELTPIPDGANGDDAETDAAPAPPSPDDSSSESATDGETAPDSPAVTAEAKGTAADDADDGSSADVPAPAANEMGRCFLQKDVLLRYAANEEVWKRLAQGDSVYAGDRLLSFPRFTPAVTLTNGVAVEMMGAAQVSLEAPNADGTPGLRIHYGRLILMPLSDPQSPVRLLIGEDEHVVSFPDTKSTLAVEVRPQLVNGSDPETTPARLNIEYYLVNGKLGWQGTPDVAAAELTAPLLWSTDPGAPTVGAEAPKWIQDERKTVSESIAAPTIEQVVRADRPVVVSLKEAANHPRHRELRSLAAKCLALVGEYDDFVAILSDPAQRPAWDGQIEELRASMARSPADAAKVRVALEKERSSDAAGLYRLLWSFTDEQFVQGGAAQELIADLEHQDMDYRVLGYWNLRQLTNMRHPYDPSEEDGKSRKDRVELWQRKVTALLKEKG